MRCDLGTFEIIQGKEVWFVLRNGDPMEGGWTTYNEAKEALRRYLKAQIDAKLDR